MPAANSLRNLPQPVAELAQACVQYYGHTALPVPGSQAAIQALPRCFTHARVWVQADTYAEHAYSWQQAGHSVQELTLAEIRAAFNNGTALPDLLILVNPANPSGECLAASELQQWTAQLHQVGGYVLVDEAFMDCTPEQSVLNVPLAPNRMVLRSLGKFFGLAGLRCGFVFAAELVQQRLQQQLGPWAVNSLALSIASQALRDEAWQQQQRLRLLRMQEQVLDTCRLWQLPVLGTPLFITFHGEQTPLMHTKLAQQKIWSRYFSAPAMVTDWHARSATMAAFIQRIKVAAGVMMMYRMMLGIMLIAVVGSGACFDRRRWPAVYAKRPSVFLNAAATELMFAVGAGQQVVGGFRLPGSKKSPVSVIPAYHSRCTGSVIYWPDRHGCACNNSSVSSKQTLQITALRC